jgi:cell division protein FtsB
LRPAEDGPAIREALRRENPLSPVAPAWFTRRVNDDVNIWGILTKLVVALVVIAILVLIFMLYRPLIDENERMRRDILKMDEEIKTQEMAVQELSTQIAILRNDTNTLERLAREKLGYARPGETIFHFDPPPTNGFAPR